MDIQVTLPTTVTADDYHEFYHLGQTLSEVFGRFVTCREVGFNHDTGKYVGVVFPGKRAPKHFIETLRAVLEATDPEKR